MTMIHLTTARLASVSFILTAGVVANAFFQKKQFYPSVVYLTKSNPSLAILYVQVFLLLLMFGKLFARIFFGELRAAESEHLIERGWYAITETCLAFTVFRDDFSPRFVGQFAFLLLAKAFHWLSEDRVDYMERSPVITVLYHARMMSLMAVLSATDSYFVSHAYFTTLLKGASVQIVFGFEYAILMTIVFHVAIKYLLHSADLRSVHPWENKAVYLLYTELLINGIRCVLYTVFVTVMIKLHTFPLFSIRPFYLTIRSLKKALNDVIMSRRAIHAMNTMFEDVNEQDLQAGDSVCIICREEMTPGAKKLPCSHIFHAACLRSWFQRQQTCPTCRSDILQTARNNQAARARAAQPAQETPAPQAQPQNVQNNMPPNLLNFMQAQNIPTNVQGAQGSTSPQIPGSSPNFNFGQTMFPMMPPMLPMPGMMPPFSLPFPSPPNLSGLSDEEVRRMESTSRQGVEARIQCLANVQTLLDAASVQLQQYTTILQAIAATPQFTSTVPEVVPSAKEGTLHPAEESGQGPSTSKITDAPVTNGKDSPQADSAPSTQIDPETEQLRQRRLEFLKKTGNTKE